eukprot:12264334-Alexandrium_andersonii.AAC.1
MLRYQLVVYFDEHTRLQTLCQPLPANPSDSTSNARVLYPLPIWKAWTGGERQQQSEACATPESWASWLIGAN